LKFEHYIPVVNLTKSGHFSIMAYISMIHTVLYCIAIKYKLNNEEYLDGFLVLQIYFKFDNYQIVTIF